MAPRRTTRPAAGSPPRSRALRSASQRRARPLSSDNSADVTDRHDDEQREEEDEADRVDRGLELRRESLAEDAGDEDEEEATAIEARERDDIQHREVHGQQADELEVRADAELRDLSDDDEDLDRAADLRPATTAPTSAARREQLTGKRRDLADDLAHEAHRLPDRVGQRHGDRTLDLLEAHAERSFALGWLLARCGLDRRDGAAIALDLQRDLLFRARLLPYVIHEVTGPRDRAVVDLPHDIALHESRERGGRVRHHLGDLDVARRTRRAGRERDRERGEREHDVHRDTGDEHDRLHPPRLRRERARMSFAFLMDREVVLSEDAHVAAERDRADGIVDLVHLEAEAPRPEPDRAVSSTVARHGYRVASTGSNRSVRGIVQSIARVGAGACFQRSAYWMKRRMSGSASCAFVLPSASSTMAWTIDSGWMTTSMRS